LGNVVLPEVVSGKYGIDTARFFLSGLASPDKDIDWSEDGIIGAARFVRKIYRFYDSREDVVDSDELTSRLNLAIRNIGDYYGNFEYRKATIKLRELFGLMEGGCSEDVARKFLKLLSPICPHITEELWEKLESRGSGVGGRHTRKGSGFISVASWPRVDEKKILKRGESGDLNSKIIERVKGIIKPRTKMIYVYVMPFELKNVDAAKISKDAGKDVKVFAVNDSEKHDPKGMAKKAKPGMAAVYLE